MGLTCSSVAIVSSTVRSSAETSFTQARRHFLPSPKKRATRPPSGPACGAGQGREGIRASWGAEETGVRVRVRVRNKGGRGNGAVVGGYI
eukprot:scaffold7018_cov120-Isochrysis_galbana.AAC.2